MASKRSFFQRKLDGILRGLFFEENGRPKSAAMLYSFLLAILFVLIYAASYLVLLDPLEKFFSGAPVPVRNAVEYAVPAVVGSALCLLFVLLPGEKKGLVAGAYLWLGLVLVAVMIFELFLIDWSDAGTEYGLFMALLGIPGILAVLTGGIPAMLLYRREHATKGAQEPLKARPSWYDS